MQIDERKLIFMSKKFTNNYLMEAKDNWQMFGIGVVCGIIFFSMLLIVCQSDIVESERIQVVVKLDKYISPIINNLPLPLFILVVIIIMVWIFGSIMTGVLWFFLFFGGLINGIYFSYKYLVWMVSNGIRNNTTT